MKKNFEIIQDAIVLAIDSLKEDICTSSDPEENLKRSLAIRNLAEAFSEVKR